MRRMNPRSGPIVEEVPPMSLRKSRFRQNKKINHLRSLEPLPRDSKAAHLLLDCRRQAKRRAATLEGPRVWNLADDPRRRPQPAAPHPSSELALQPDVHR